jgi:hypothetical protein
MYFTANIAYTAVLLWRQRVVRRFRHFDRLHVAHRSGRRSLEFCLLYRFSRAPRGGAECLRRALRFSRTSYRSSKLEVERQARHLFSQTSNCSHNLGSPRSRASNYFV